MRRLQLASLVAIAAAMAFAETAAAADLTITSWGGAYQTSQRKAYYEPYAQKKGAKITEEEYNGEIAKIRAMVEAKDVTWDVVDVDTQTAQQGCDEGIFETLDYSKIRDKSEFIPGSATDCAVGTIVYSTIFAYDTDKLKDGPTKIADLWNIPADKVTFLTEARDTFGLGLLKLGIESATLKSQIFKRLAQKYLCDVRQEVKDRISTEIEAQLASSRI